MGKYLENESTYVYICLQKLQKTVKIQLEILNWVPLINSDLAREWQNLPAVPGHNESEVISLYRDRGSEVRQWITKHPACRNQI